MTSQKRTMTKVQRRALLKTRYLKMGRAEKLYILLGEVVDDFDAGVITADRFEGCGMVVIGESGSGKSKEIDMALKRLLETRPRLECGLETRYLQDALRGETTWKALGLQLLERLGYQISASRTEHEIWSRVRAQLQGQGIWLIHIDECQHMFQTLGENETKKVINAIKTFMKDRQWPLAVILSGIPELLEKVNLDNQLRNLIKPFALGHFDPFGDDIDEIDSFVYGVGEAVGIDVSAIRDHDVYMRMAYGHENLYGKVFRFIVEVISKLPDGEIKVTPSHLAEHYGQSTGCAPGQNVFLREDYEACNVSVLMASD